MTRDAAAGGAWDHVAAGEELAAVLEGEGRTQDGGTVRALVAAAKLSKMLAAAKARLEQEKTALQVQLNTAEMIYQHRIDPFW